MKIVVDAKRKRAKRRANGVVQIGGLVMPDSWAIEMTRVPGTDECEPIGVFCARRRT